VKKCPTISNWQLRVIERERERAREGERVAMFKTLYFWDAEYEWVWARCVAWQDVVCHFRHTTSLITTNNIDHETHTHMCIERETYREFDWPDHFVRLDQCVWNRLFLQFYTVVAICTHTSEQKQYIKSKVSGGDTQAKCITYDSCRTKSRRDNFFCTPSLRTVSDKSAGNYRAKKYIHLAFIHSLTQTPHTHNIHTILTCS